MLAFLLLCFCRGGLHQAQSARAEAGAPRHLYPCPCCLPCTRDFHTCAPAHSSKMDGDLTTSYAQIKSRTRLRAYVLGAITRRQKQSHAGRSQSSHRIQACTLDHPSIDMKPSPAGVIIHSSFNRYKAITPSQVRAIMHHSIHKKQ